MAIGQKYATIGKGMFLLWVMLFTIPQISTIIIIQLNGVLFAYTGFYWLVNIGFILGALVLIWKYDHPISQILGIIYCVFVGYVSFRYLQPHIAYFNLPMFVINIFMVILLGLNLLRFLMGFIYQIITLKIIRRLKGTKLNRKTAISLIIIGFWIAMISWSYIGFNQTYTIEDPGQEDFRVSFYGLPSMGYNFSKYNTPEADTELGLYKSLNATFITIIIPPYLASPDFESNLTAIIHEFEEWNIDIIIDCRPMITFYDGADWITTDDYPSYWYAEAFNESLDIITDWVQLESFTNFRGIALDIEGMIYPNNSKPMSFEVYEQGRISYTEKFNEFRAEFPGKVINGISMEGTMWDPIDGDYDLDVAQRTISNELDLDIYGYMTYHTGSASPSFSDYRYYSYLQHGYRQHGEKFQPWIGWWYDPLSEDDPNVIENPFIYEQTLTQFKIAKSFGVPEVVLAPISNFIGRNWTEGMGRLQDLVDIKEDGFDSFTIPITNNMRLINDFSYWLRKIFPTYWIANESVFEDLQLGSQFNWLFWIQFVVCCIYTVVCVLYGRGILRKRSSIN